MTFSILGAGTFTIKPNQWQQSSGPSQLYIWCWVGPDLHGTRRCVFDLMAFFCSSNVWGLNCYIDHVTLKEKGENSVNSWQKRGTVVLLGVFFARWEERGERQDAQNTTKSFSPWERSGRVYYFLTSCVCLVKHSTMVINMWLLWPCTCREHSVTLLFWVNWIL